MTEPRPRILIVDDSRVIRHAARKALAGEYDLSEALDGEDAWQQLGTGVDVDLVLCDLHMPNLDGFGLLRRLRGEAPEDLRGVPVIMVTGEEDTDAAREQALAQGATDLINKPFDPLHLRARVRGYVDARRQSRHLAHEAHELAERNRIDPLTRLGNRSFVLEHIERARSFAVRHGATFSVVCLQADATGAAADLDPRLAAVFAARVRREDAVGRIGPGRFVLVLPNVGNPGARFLARRARREIGSFPEEPQVHAAVLTPLVPAESDAHAILAQAEALLERARAEGATVLSAVDLVPEEASAAPTDERDTEAWLDLEQAVSMLARGERAAVEPHLQRLLGRLMPMLRLLSPAQRQWLFQQLGMNRSETR